MASPALVDIDALLAPITDESPAGSDCRQDPSPNSYYQQIKVARNAARTAERNNMFGGSSEEAEEHWRKVMDLAPRILREQSKDLEVASWLSEAMIRRHGFSGLRDVFHLIFSLIDRYWDNLYPAPDEDGLETRVAPLAGLNGEGAEGVLIAPVRNTLITEGSSVGPFSYWEYQQALEAQRVPNTDAREDKIKKLGYSLDTIEKAVSESSSVFFTNLRDDLDESIRFYRQISNRLDELCGTFDAPPTSNILNILEECHGAVLHLGQNKFPVPAAPETESDGEAEGPTADTVASAPKAVAGQIANREQAFKQLLEIAEFFRKTEPHSPVSYMLEKAVKWGSMPLHELVAELIPDNSAQEHYRLLTGVKTDE